MRRCLKVVKSYAAPRAQLGPARWDNAVTWPNMVTQESGFEMAGRGEGPDFVEALARGLDILACFNAERPWLTLTEVATATGLAPHCPTPIADLGGAGLHPVSGNQFTLTPRCCAWAWRSSLRWACGTSRVRISNGWSPPPGNPRRCRSSMARTSSTSPESPSQTDRPAGRDRYAVPGRLHRPGQSAPRRAGPRRPTERPREPSRSACHRTHPRHRKLRAELQAIRARGWA